MVLQFSTPVNNSTGFSALPGGVVDRVDKRYEGLGVMGVWWTSTEINSYNAIERDLSYNQTDMGEHERQKDMAMSVRCIKD